MILLHTLEVVLLQGDVSLVTPLLVKEGAVCRRKSEHHGGSKNAEIFLQGRTIFCKGWVDRRE
jgi:hypothetical protein